MLPGKRSVAVYLGVLVSVAAAWLSSSVGSLFPADQQNPTSSISTLVLPTVAENTADTSLMSVGTSVFITFHVFTPPLTWNFIIPLSSVMFVTGTLRRSPFQLSEFGVVSSVNEVFAVVPGNVSPSRELASSTPSAGTIYMQRCLALLFGPFMLQYSSCISFV